MGENERADISDRLTTLEVQVVEKWYAHDKRSDERWADLMEKFHEMAKKMDHPCTAHGEFMLGLDHRMKALEKWQMTINWAIGVVYGALVVALIKILLEHK